MPEIDTAKLAANSYQSKHEFDMCHLWLAGEPLPVSLPKGQKFRIRTTMLAAYLAEDPETRAEVWKQGLPPLPAIATEVDLDFSQFPPPQKGAPFWKNLQGRHLEDIELIAPRPEHLEGARQVSTVFLTLKNWEENPFSNEMSRMLPRIAPEDNERFLSDVRLFVIRCQGDDLGEGFLNYLLRCDTPSPIDVFISGCGFRSLSFPIEDLTKMKAYLSLRLQECEFFPGFMEKFLTDYLSRPESLLADTLVVSFDPANRWRYFQTAPSKTEILTETPPFLNMAAVRNLLPEGDLALSGPSSQPALLDIPSAICMLNW